jgi:hypothetical protein
VAIICGRRLWFGYRYESWVQMVSYRPQPRVDLSPLAEELCTLETQGARWTFDGVDQLTPALHLDDATESTIDPDRFLVMLGDALTTGAPAWDPYDRR